MYLHMLHQSESDPDTSHSCYLEMYVMFGTLVLLRCFPFRRVMAYVWHIVGVLSNEVCVYNFMCQSGNSGFCHWKSGEICANWQSECEAKMWERATKNVWGMETTKVSGVSLKSWNLLSDWLWQVTFWFLQPIWGVFLSFQIDRYTLKYIVNRFME